MIKALFQKISYSTIFEKSPTNGVFDIIRQFITICTVKFSILSTLSAKKDFSHSLAMIVPQAVNKHSIGRGNSYGCSHEESTG